MIPKLGVWSAENQRPITCTNTQYKWYASVILTKLSNHLEKYHLMQRGAKQKCNGTAENLLLDSVVLRDVKLHQRKLSVAWIDVREAYDSVNHGWIRKILEVHRLPDKLTAAIRNIIHNWNVIVLIPTINGTEKSEGDSICGCLYTMSINPTAWKLRTQDGYQLSKPVQGKIAHSLFVDDLKIYAKSKEKLTKVLSETKSQMMDAGLVWREVKCAVLHLKRGKVVDKDGDIRLDEEITLKCLENQPYKFLEMPETDIHNTDKLIQLLIENISQRTVIWTSPLSDFNKVLATNSFAMSLVNYFMWSQRITITDLRKIDAAILSIINDVYAKHKNQMNSILYLPRNYGGCGLISVEVIYKKTKLKSLAKIVTSRDPRIQLVREFENEQYNKGRCSIFKDAIKFANDLGMTVDYGPDSFCLKYKDARDKTYETSDVKCRKIFS